MKLFTVIVAATLAGGLGMTAAADTKPTTTAPAAPQGTAAATEKTADAKTAAPAGSVLFDKYCGGCHPKTDPPRPGEQPKAEDMRELPPDQMKMPEAPPITMMAAIYRQSAGSDKTKYLSQLTTFLKTPTTETALDQRAVKQFGLKKPMKEKFPEITDAELTTIVDWMWDRYTITGPVQGGGQQGGMQGGQGGFPQGGNQQMMPGQQQMMPGQTPAVQQTPGQRSDVAPSGQQVTPTGQQVIAQAAAPVQAPAQAQQTAAVPVQQPAAVQPPAPTQQPAAATAAPTQQPAAGPAPQTSGAGPQVAAAPSIAGAQVPQMMAQQPGAGGQQPPGMGMQAGQQGGPQMPGQGGPQQTPQPGSGMQQGMSKGMTQGSKLPAADSVIAQAEGGKLFKKFCGDCHPRSDSPDAGDTPQVPPDQMKIEAPPMSMMAAHYRQVTGGDKNKYITRLVDFNRNPSEDKAVDPRSVKQFGIKKPIDDKHPEVTDAELASIAEWMWEYYKDVFIIRLPAHGVWGR